MNLEFIREAAWREPTPIDIDSLHNHAVDWATKLFYDRVGEEPLSGFFALAGMGQVACLQIQWGNDEEKYRAAYAVRKLCKNVAIEAYSFITEAWAVVIPPEADVDLDTLPQPRHNPEREDILQIWTSTREGKHRATRFGCKYYKLDPLQMILGATPKKPRLLERDDHIIEDHVTMVGSMFNFFDSYEESERKIEESRQRDREQGRRKDK